MTVYSAPVSSATNLAIGTTQTDGTVVDLGAIVSGFLIVTNSGGGSGSPTGSWGWRGSLDNENWYWIGSAPGISGDFGEFVNVTYVLVTGAPARYVKVTGIATGGSPVITLGQVVPVVAS